MTCEDELLAAIQRHTAVVERMSEMLDALMLADKVIRVYGLGNDEDVQAFQDRVTLILNAEPLVVPDAHYEAGVGDLVTAYGETKTILETGDEEIRGQALLAAAMANAHARTMTPEGIIGLAQQFEAYIRGDMP